MMTNTHGMGLFAILRGVVALLLFSRGIVHLVVIVCPTCYFGHICYFVISVLEYLNKYKGM